MTTSITTLDRVNSLTDAEIVSVYKSICRDLYSSLTNLSDVKDVARQNWEDPDELKGKKVSNEDITAIARESLRAWAADPSMSPLVDDFIENRQETYGVDLVISLGAILVSTIVASSLKIEQKDGKRIISYDPTTISPAVVQIVNNFFNVLPETLKAILGIK